MRSSAENNPVRSRAGDSRVGVGVAGRPDVGGVLLRFCSPRASMLRCLTLIVLALVGKGALDSPGGIYMMAG